MKFIIIPIEYSDEGFIKIQHDLRACVNFESISDDEITKRIALIFNSCLKAKKSHIIVDADATLDKCVIASKSFADDNKWDLTSHFINDHVLKVDDYINSKKNQSEKNSKNIINYDIDELLTIISEKGFDYLDDNQKKFLDEFSKKH